MFLAPGSRLGPYEILGPIGAGGMGEVYRARDTRLDRNVAIKILGDRLPATEEVRRRFEREAKTISQLSDPHICALYDVGKQDDVEYLVMEYLEGETLADRLARGPLSAGQTLRYGGEMAEALDVAHRRGIVHRDLKPSNVMLTKSGVKLLDFGLARAIARAAVSSGELTGLPTAADASGLTREGTIVGTLQYMAPEQIEGREADARTDIFALGSLLFEMATGEKAFSGTSRASLMAAILQSEPSAASSSGSDAPGALDRVIATALAKDPEKRWQSARDVALQLAEIAGGPKVEAPKRSTSRFWKWAAAAGVVAAGLALLLRPRSPAAAAATPIRFLLAPPPGGRFNAPFEDNTFALSPDGTRIVFSVVEAGGRQRLWLRALSDTNTRPIDGTDEGISPFWSPDGRSIAFFANEKLKRLELSGGAPLTISDGGKTAIGRSGSWGVDGKILFGDVLGEAIYRISADGGQPEVAVRPDPKRLETRVVWPWFLPDGRRFLYSVRHADGQGEICLFEPGRPPRGLVGVRSMSQYSDPGYLVFARDGVLVGQRFEPGNGTVSGTPFSIAPAVGYFLSTGWAAFGTSRNGTLVYQSSTDVDRLVWFDRTGHALAEVGSRGNYLSLAVSPDGRRVLFSRARPGIGTYDVWLLDLERGVETAVTSDPDSEFGAVWTPDGKSILYSSVRTAGPRLFSRELATGREVALLPERGFQMATDVTRDGRLMAFSERRPGTAFELFTMALSGGEAPRKIVPVAFNSEVLRFSPDGKAIAFLSGESGRDEAYVAPFGTSGERIRISAAGAKSLRWSRDGKEIVFLTSASDFVAVPVRTTPTLEVGKPSTLFRVAEGKGWKGFDLAPDGRILAIVNEITASAQPATVAVNWTAEVKPEGGGR